MTRCLIIAAGLFAMFLGLACGDEELKTAGTSPTPALTATERAEDESVAMTPTEAKTAAPPIATATQVPGRPAAMTPGEAATSTPRIATATHELEGDLATTGTPTRAQAPPVPSATAPPTTAPPPAPTPTAESAAATPSSAGSTEGTLIWGWSQASTGSAGSSVIVRFADGMTVRLLETGLVSLGPHDVEALRVVLARYPIVEVSPVFTRPVAELEEERRLAEEATGEPQPDLTLFFQVTLEAEVDAALLVSDLVPLDVVETAYIAASPEPPPAPPGG